MAGKVRYLDSRPDEQLRGITMESSAISLYFKTVHKSRKGEGVTGTEEKDHIKEYLINLIDSPGHVDFSSEVSIASRLCDGAVVLVDVVEGVCSQTVTVLRQCWVDKLKPILVLNKIDRLITELQMSTTEAYLHLSKVIEQVNSVIGSFYAGERMQENYLWRVRMEEGDTTEFVEKDDADIYFSPEKNNVIFASAVDGWGFNVAQFAVIYERKLGVAREKLQKYLWGDYYLDPKTKKIITSKGLKGRNLKPMFVMFVLENIWYVYNVAVLNRDQEKLEKVVKSIKVKVLPRELKSKDTKQLINTIMSQWIPVSNAVLLTVADKLPSPLESQKQRIQSILDFTPGSKLIDSQLRNDMIECNKKGNVSCYVSKMLLIPEADLPENQREAVGQDQLAERGRQARIAAAKAAEAAKMVEDAEKESDDIHSRVQDSTANNEFEFEFEEEGNDGEAEDDRAEKEALVGFARMYSGTLSVGDEVSVLRPRFDPAKPAEHISKTTITSLYLLMGRDLIALKTVPAGNIVGIGGLAGHLLKSGTLVTPGVLGASLAGMNITSPPIVKVALEPENPTQMDRLEKGLELLNQADPCVQTYLEGSGEHILATAGELHLERCLKDLRERFAGIEITASKPVIPYRETIVSEAEMNPSKNPELGRGGDVLTLDKYKITFQTLPLPKEATKLLLENGSTIREIQASENSQKIEEVREEGADEVEGDISGDNNIQGSEAISVDTFREKLGKAFDDYDELKVKDNIRWSSSLVERIAAFGPKRVGPNILFDSEDQQVRRLFSRSSMKASDRFEHEYSLISGFQLAVSQGPLVAEPMEGTAIFIKSIERIPDEDVVPIPNVSGRLISATKDSIHKGFLDWSPRLMLAMYVCDIQASAEVLGKVYAVVQKRKGSIVKEEMKEGTPFFTITAKIPVVEAFGFSDDIRKRTSGAASPQLVFAGFEAIDQDPFWVPATEEELVELGEVADKENVARKYMNTVRKRKGLFVDEKVVENAEKQRTLKKD
ncbi:DEKNAAC101191 [Brettanomyces naardenensis]|uniref:Ribosome assembly protein 1 n=1 Tax=Brettanomyces naardenensis TaxID=13370 RepID=A0A448YH66_BRENA|nr:DEKNAAC101191 [Brettanomyces naardenensis]